MPSIDVDRDAAHQAAQTELDKPIYSKASVGQQVIAWIHEQVYRLMQTVATIPGGWVTATVLLVVLAVVLVVAFHIARRTMRTKRGDGHMLFDSTQLTAAQHRAAAEGHAAEGNWAVAIRHRLRAVARQLEETGVLNPAPGRTANELAREAGTALPYLAGELSQAATTFDEVTYGDQAGTEAAYQTIADLDDQLRSRTATAPSGVEPPAAAGSWAQVR